LCLASGQGIENRCFAAFGQPDDAYLHNEGSSSANQGKAILLLGFFTSPISGFLLVGFRGDSAGGPS
jgi:hypothetical protein